MAINTAADNVLTLLNSSRSRKTNTSSTSTQQTQYSDQALQQLINGILAGPGGVKDIGARARGSGLYDSTSEQLLLGNLYATAANQAAVARAPTVQTTNTQSVTPGASPLETLTAIAATPLLNSALNNGSELLSKGYDAVKGLLGIGDGTDISSGVNVGATAGGGLGSVGLGSALSTPVSGAEVSSGLSGGADILNGGTSTVAGAGGTSAAGTTAAADSFTSSALSYLPYAGALAGGLVNGSDNKKGYITSAGSGALIGGEAGGPVGALIGAALGGIGNLVGAKTIICTALMERGLLPEKKYELGRAYLNKLSTETKAGYHVWANWVAEEIRRGNVWAIAISLPIATSRMDLLGSNCGFIAHCRYPLGTITKFVGEPICWIVGKLLKIRTKLALVKMGV